MKVSTAELQANALLELAVDDAHRARLIDGCAIVAMALGAEPRLRPVMADLAVGLPERQELLRRIFADRIDPLLMDWLCVLARGQFDALGDILAAVDVATRRAEGDGPPAVAEINAARARLERELAERLFDAVAATLKSVAEAARRADGERVRVTTAVTLGDEERATLERNIAARLGREVDCRFEIDPLLLGGAVIRYGDRRIDGSLRAKLDKLGERLRAAPVDDAWGADEGKGD